MPASDADLAADPSPDSLTALPFLPIRRSHILNCSYHSWHPRYRAITPKARLIPLTPAFVSYLRADGIFLPDDDEPQYGRTESDDGIFSKDQEKQDEDEDEDEDEEEEEVDHFSAWQDIHQQIKSTIAELGGRVAPKLNWSAPKDATWINATNSMDCRSPNDIYLLLKSSDFVTHDLEHVFDGCIDEPPPSSTTSNHLQTPQTPQTKPEIPYHLVLRKYLLYNPAVEFRCFVRRRKLLGICQRDLNHFDFLFEMQDALRDAIQDFFDQKLRDTFPDENFVFDVYLPPPHQRVWLVDINPWAPRTDPLLFSWLELLTMPEPPSAPEAQPEESFVRLSLRGPNHAEEIPSASGDEGEAYDDGARDAGASTAGGAGNEAGDESEDEVDFEFPRPEFRLIRRDDPEAYSFNTPQYSAHKLPRDVVDAGQGGVGPMREFAEQWKEMLERRRKEEEEEEEEGEGEV